MILHADTIPEPGPETGEYAIAALDGVPMGKRDTLASVLRIPLTELEISLSQKPPVLQTFQTYRQAEEFRQSLEQLGIFASILDSSGRRLFSDPEREKNAAEAKRRAARRRLLLVLAAVLIAAGGIVSAALIYRYRTAWRSASAGAADDAGVPSAGAQGAADADGTGPQMPLETCLAMIRFSLEANAGETEQTYDVYAYGDTVCIDRMIPDIWTLVFYAQQGNTAQRETWNQLVRDAESLSRTTRTVLEENGRPESVCVNLVNDNDPSRVLLSVMDGTVLYDYVNGVNDVDG